MRRWMPLIIISILLTPLVLGVNYWDYLTKPYADTLYCAINGDCTLNNLTILGGYFNVTVENYNVTGNIYVTGNVTGNSETTATITVCASNSLNPSLCDYTADGTADEVEINNALNALPSSGGRVVLLDGNYNLAGDITIPNDKINFRGQGDASRIDLNSNNIILEDRFNIHINNLFLNNGELRLVASTGNIKITNSFFNNTLIDKLPFGAANTDRIYIANNIFNKGGISLKKTFDSFIGNNIIINNTASAIYIDPNSKRTVITGNEVKFTTIQRTISLQGSDNLLFGNTIINCSADCIELGGSNNNIISNNYIADADGNGIYITGSSNNNVISSNRITNSKSYAVNIDAGMINNTIMNNQLVGNINTILDNGDNTTVMGNFPGGSSMEIQTAVGEEIKMIPEQTHTATFYPNNTTFYKPICLSSDLGNYCFNETNMSAWSNPDNSYGNPSEIPYTNADSDDFSYGNLSYNASYFLINNSAPEIRLEDSDNNGYTKITKDNNSDEAERLNEVEVTGGTIEGLVHHYKLNDNASNTIVTDSNGVKNKINVGGNTNTKSRGNCPTNTDKCFWYDNSADYQHYNKPASFEGATELSIAFWIKSASNASEDWIYHSYGTSAGQRNFYIKKAASTNALSIVIFHTDNTWSNYISSGAGIGFTDNVWTHVVVTWKASTDTIEWYIDGVDLNRGGSEGGVGTKPNLIDTLGVNPTIGTYSSYYYHGYLDDFRVYDKVLSQSAVDSIYNNGDGTEGNTLQASNQEVSIWNSQANEESSIYGTTIFGDSLAHTQLDGDKIEFLVSGSEVGNFSYNSNFYVGENITANDVCNQQGMCIGNITETLVADEIYINKINNNFTFNLSKLSTTYYNATEASTIAGTVVGYLNLTHHRDGHYDGYTFNATEAAGSPGLDLRMNFTNITTFNGGVIRYRTDYSAGDFPIIQLWDYDDSKWEDYPLLAESGTFATITQAVFDPSEHISDGVANVPNGLVQMRLYKATNGNINNDYHIDWVALYKGFGTPSSEEIDPLAFHKSGDDPMEGNADWGNHNLSKVDELNSTKISSTDYCDSSGDNCIEMTMRDIDADETVLGFILK